MCRKIIVIALCMFVFATSAKASDLSSMCSQPYDMSWKSTQVITTITGMTFLSQAVANSIIKKELRKSMGSKHFRVKMKSFSANDLAAGRFKSLDISGKDLNLDGVYLSKFSASTICDFNYIKATKKSVKFKENFAMKYSMAVTEDDLKKTVLSESYLKFLNSLNIKAGGINLLELKNIDLKLKDNRFLFSMYMDNRIFNYSVPFEVDVSTKMSVQNGQLKLSEIVFQKSNKMLNLSQVSNILNIINPLKYTVNILDNENAKVEIKTLDIKDKKLALDGTVFIPKNMEESRK